MIHPIILCGGAGTRLWPLSRADKPKQFAPLFNGESLLDQTLQRFAGAQYAAPRILTHKGTQRPAQLALQRLGMTDATLIAEPLTRGNAPAILATLCDPDLDPDAIFLVAASDHVLRDPDGFHAAVTSGADAARQGRIVTFGVQPDRPETGYGYLEPETPVRPGDPASPLRRFIEKPDADKASAMIAAGNVLWNAGIALFRGADMHAAFTRHAPDLLAPCQAAMARATRDPGLISLDEDSYAGAENISLDYAVLEKADNLSVVALESGWSDLGSWQSLHAELPTDANGVVTTGAAKAFECTNSLLWADRPDQQVIGLGLDNIIAVATADTVLVAHMDKNQEIGALARSLQGSEPGSPDQHSWGWQESLNQSPGLHVFRLALRPGATLETAPPASQWVLHSGSLRVTDGQDQFMPSPGAAISGKTRSTLGFENLGKEFVYMIGISIGSGAHDEDPDAPSQTQDLN